MRKQNHSIPPVLKHNSRLNSSVALHRKHKRPNAQKHGVFAEPLILPGEDPREFEALHSALIEEWNPSGPSEESRRLRYCRRRVAQASVAQICGGKGDWQQFKTRPSRFR